MSAPAERAGDFFEAVYRAQAPDGSVIAAAGWDIGEPQPTVVELERLGRIGGEVLDAGCGTGENALYLAARGYLVTGLDVAPSAIAHAAAKASLRGLDVAFATADAREFAGYENRFDTVLDSGLYHIFDVVDRSRYVHALERVCAPGGVVHILAVSDAAEPGPGPRRLTEEQMREQFRDAWRIEELRRDMMLGVLPGGRERVEIPGWLLTARRRRSAN